MAKWLGLVTLLASACLWGLAHATAADGLPRNGKIDIDAVFKKLDTNKDGKLSRDEFVKMADRAKEEVRARVRARLSEAYDRLDPEKKGLTKEQFKTFLEMRRKEPR